MKAVLKLAEFLEYKYKINKIGNVNEKRILDEVKKELIQDAFVNYVSFKSRDPALQIVANAGYLPVVNMIHTFNKLIANIDDKSPYKLINDLNEVLGFMYDINKDKFKSVNDFIDDTFSGFNHAAINERNRLKQKFSKKMERLFSITQKAANKLRILVPDVEVHEGSVSANRRSLTRDELRNFVMMAPPFQSYGLDSLDIMGEILQDTDLTDLVTTLINSVKRGHLPLDGPAVNSAAKKIKKILDEKIKTNAPVFESSEEKFQKTINVAPDLEKDTKKKLASWLKNIQTKYSDKGSL